MGTYHVLHNPHTIKDALDKSGIYSAVVSEGLSKIQPSTSTGSIDQIPLTDPGVQAVIQQAISPQYIEQQTNNTLDSIYAWMQGKGDLNIHITLGDAKAQLADGLAGYAQERLTKLPICTTASQISTDFDPFTATCLPPKFDAAAKAAATQKVRSEVMQNQDHLKDTTITQNTVQDGSSQTIVQRLRTLPSIYKQVTYGLYVSGGLTVLSTACIALWSATIRRGLRRTGIIYVAIGATSAFLAWFAGMVLSKVSITLASSNTATELQAKSIETIRLVTNDIRQWWLIYGIILAGIGITCIIVALLMRGNTHKTPAGPDVAPRATPPEATPTSTTSGTSGQL